MRTAALVSLDGSSESLPVLPSEVCHDAAIVESYCVPNFDSPSIFARILDKDKVQRISLFINELLN